MFTEKRAWRKLIGLCAAVAVQVAAGPYGIPARANDSNQEERAFASWSVRTRQGRVHFEIDVRRAAEPGEPQITTGFIAARSCSRPDPRGPRTCISSADLKRVADDSFEMDPAMSSASFEMTFAGIRHGAEWEAESQPPGLALDRLAQREVSVERDAIAQGRAFKKKLVGGRLKEAGIERGATIDDSLPPVPVPNPPLRATNASSGSSTCWSYKPEERGFAREMNRERAARGLGKMRLDPELSKAARVHTREMTRATLLHHTDSSSLRRRVTNWIILGENVGVGGTVSSLHGAFMASPTHKENILFKRFNWVGVGTASSGGRLWVTVIFETRENPGTPLRMRKC